jgi:uncharacterized protein (TIGR03118 family)
MLRSRVLLAAAAALALLPTVARAGPFTFSVTPLVADQPGVSDALGFGPARHIDPQLVNAWGVSFGRGGPIWVSNNGTGFSTLYDGNGVKQGLVVAMAGNTTANPVPITGQVNNGTSSFNGNIFLFAGENGAIYGWRGALGTTSEVLKPPSDPNTGDVYKGLVLNGSTLIATNFRTGKLDVFSGSIGAFSNPSVTDPNLPSGFAPFGIETLGGKTYVTYAKQDPAGHDDVAGPGNGLIDIVDANGRFLSRFATGGQLNSPWGMAIAPSTFGPFAGDLLVGNFGDGTINAFDPNTGAFLGKLLGADGNPLMIDGLWALSLGSGSATAPTNRLFFTAGPNGESNGLFGSIDPSVPEPTSVSLFLVGGAGLLLLRLRKSRPA